MAAPFPLFEGKYEIITKLKEGGMGAVYKVRHRLLDEVRVIKLIRPHLESDEAIRARFLREARTAVKLRHPNIAQFYDFSMDDEGNAFIVMEFIEGITLEELLVKAGPPPLPLALEIVEQSLRPIGYLHRRNIIHRDISPDNLMLSRTDEGLPLVKLIDLGIAKVLEEEGHSQITRRGLTGTGMFLGKVRYASPEQFHAQEGVTMDARSDLYSFGLVLYELLTGLHPIRGSSVPSFIAGHLFHPPIPFEESDPSARVPEDLRAAVLRALAKSPDARFASAEEFVKALAPIKARYPLSAQDAVVAFDDFAGALAEKTRTGTVGSTQARLDRQFGMAPTPPPAPVSTPGAGQAMAELEPPAQQTLAQSPAPPAHLAPAPEDTNQLQFRPREAEEAVCPAVDRGAGIEETRVLAVPGAGATRAAMLVTAARELVDQGRWGEALERLTTAASLDPDNTDVKVLRERAEQALAAEAERARRASALAAHARHVEDLLDAGQLEQARLGLETALAEVGRDEALDALLARLAEAEEALALAYRGQAEAALAAGRPADAIEAVHQAVALRPDDESLRQLLHQAEAARARQQAAAEAAAAIAAALAAEDLPTARSQLEMAVSRLGEDDTFESLRRQIERAETRVRTARARELLAAAREHLEGGRLGEARAAAGQALDLRPHDLETAAVLADVKAAEERLAAEQRAAEERRAEEQRLAAAKAAAVEEIRRLVGAGLLADAAAAAQAARAGHRDFPELEAAERELEAAFLRQRQQATSALLVEAERLAGEQQFEAAEAKLEEAGGLSPADERVLQALVEVRSAARQFREAEERRREAAAEAAAVARALDAGNLEEAAERFDSTVRKHGDRPELRELRRRLREARRAEDERRAAERKAARAARQRPAADVEQVQTVALERAEDVAPGAEEAALERAPTRPLKTPREGGRGLPAAREAEPEVRRADQVETAAPLADVREAIPATLPAEARPALGRRRWPLVAGLAAAAVVVVVVGVTVMRSRPGPAAAPSPVRSVPAGTPAPAPVGGGVLVVAAAPWGEVLSVRREDGVEVELPAQRATPMRLAVPAGRYTVTVRDPASGATRQGTAEVKASAAARLVVEVRAAGADELLKRLGWPG